MASNVNKLRTRCLTCCGTGKMGSDALAPDGLLAFATVPCAVCAGTGLALEPVRPAPPMNDVDEFEEPPPWDE